MASHDQAVETLLVKGLRHRKLDEVLASNCSLDWFGRSFVGQPKVIDFYLNSHSNLEHSLTTVSSTEAFEDRPNHLLTRIQPVENLKVVAETCEDDKWLDCKNTLLNMKEAQLTPTHKSTPSQCPPAPRRYAMDFVDSSDDELDLNDDDDDSLNESGICPLDSTIELKYTKAKSPKSKKLRREEKLAPCTASPSASPAPPEESKYSELHYLEASGSVNINRQSTQSAEAEKRDCIVLISYRIYKTDPSIIQIALIVYKSNSMNPKTRRNLMTEFQEKASELISTPTTMLRCRSSIKDKPSTESDAPRQAMKRPISKASLRF